MHKDTCNTKHNKKDRTARMPVLFGRVMNMHNDDITHMRTTGNVDDDDQAHATKEVNAGPDQCRRVPASGMSGSMATLDDETVDSVRPLKSPTRALLTARMGCCPSLKLCAPDIVSPLHRLCTTESFQRLSIPR